MLRSAPLLISLLATPALATVAAGSKPAPIELKGELGGRTDGKPWSSDMIQGKVWTLFYVDPDEKDANEAMEAALKAANLPKDKYGSIAVINMDATWLPNAALASSLESKQEKYPDVTYVKDYDKVLVKQWKLKDDAYVVVVFDKQGKVLWSKDGTFSKDDTNKLLEVIKSHLEDPAA